jgi:tetratricopeptide (TPR) repeat protein
MKKLYRYLLLTAVAFSVAGQTAFASNKEAKHFLSNGDAKMKAGNPNEAISIYNKAIDYEPKLSRTNLSEVYFKRGYAKAALGDSEGAREDYRMSIQLDPTPKDAEAYYNRGIAKTALGDSEGAKVDFRRASMLGYNNARKMLNAKDTKNIPFDANFEADIYLNSGKEKLEKGDQKNALADFNKAIEYNNRLAAAYFYRGMIERTNGDNQGATADFKKAIEVDPTPSKAEAYYIRGRAKANAGDNEGALKDLTKALDLNPVLGEAYTYRGKVKESMGDREGATADFKKAEKFNVVSK